MNYFAAPGPFTDFGDDIERTENADAALRHVRALLKPALSASMPEHVSVFEKRSARDILSVALEVKRAHPGRLAIGDSRSYCVLLVAFLRASFIAARVRNSFVNYLEEERWTSRWLVEVVEPRGNRTIDPQLDASLAAKTTRSVDPDNLAAENVRNASAAWLRVRSHQDDARLYGFASHRGIGVLREALYRDVCALNKLELLSTDHFFGFRDQQTITQREYKILDHLAETAERVGDEPGELEVLFSDIPELGRSVVFQLGLASDVPEIWPKSEEVVLMRLLSSSADEDEGDINEDWFGVSTEAIRVRGANENNLQNIQVDLPHGAFIVVTGMSGSGKSSLAFDTIYAASQRRFIESLSPYIRRHIDKIKEPNVRRIDGLLPSIAIEQKTISRNPRSTVGTITRTSPLLRLLFSRAGQRRCLRCGHPVDPMNPASLARRLNDPAMVFRSLSAAVDHVNIASIHRCLRRAKHFGLVDCVSADGTSLSLDPVVIAEAHDPRIVISTGDRVAPDDIRMAFDVGDGVVVVGTKAGEVRIADRPLCPACRLASPELTSEAFTANSGIAHCDTCSGVGSLIAVDEAGLVADDSRSILDGALTWFTELRSGKQTGWPVGNLEKIAAFFGDDLETPWRRLSAEFKNAILYGLPESVAKRGGAKALKIRGLIPEIERLHRITGSSASKKKYERFMKKSACPTCRGTGLKRQALAVELGGHTFDQVQNMTVSELYEWTMHLVDRAHPKALIIRPIAREMSRRLAKIADVGLPYLSLNRSAPTLSGGEGQRLRLSRQLGIGLTGILYVLDEPSIGLHAADINRLIRALRELVEGGNTVLVVEHDEATMWSADLIIDIGWGAGRDGGRVMAQGTPKDISNNLDSLTGAYLSGRKDVLDGLAPPNKPSERTHWIRLFGAKRYNLKDIDVRVPMGHLTVVSGISGSGKSTLLSELLVPALIDLANAVEPKGDFKKIEIDRLIRKVLTVDQKAIGKTPRSCPATYLKLMDPIRYIFAGTSMAKSKGFGPGHFSFNIEAGGCLHCKGLGSICIEMHFLPDVWTECPECKGQRFQDTVLDVKWRDVNIAEVLGLDIEEAIDLFSDIPAVANGLRLAVDVGLGYLSLGQSSVSLSGGEAQRLKLCRELLEVRADGCVYVLDEPTTGLHFSDINKLLGVVRRLVDERQTVIIIEHNLDVIRSADWVIDLGPEGGVNGGRLLYQGEVEGLLTCEESATGRWLKTKHPA